VSDTSTTLIPVRVTQYAPYQEFVSELSKATGRDGLRLVGDRWFATQGELDTPHTTFRLSPR
jgi:hypothetical protein